MSWYPKLTGLFKLVYVPTMATITATYAKATGLRLQWTNGAVLPSGSIVRVFIRTKEKLAPNYIGGTYPPQYIKELPATDLDEYFLGALDTTGVYKAFDTIPSAGAGTDGNEFMDVWAFIIDVHGTNHNPARVIAIEILNP